MSFLPVSSWAVALRGAIVYCMIVSVAIVWLRSMTCVSRSARGSDMLQRNNTLQVARPVISGATISLLARQVWIDRSESNASRSCQGTGMEDPSSFRRALLSLLLPRRKLNSAVLRISW